MRLLDDTWKHIRRSPYQSMAAVITMFFTMLLSGFFFLATISSALILRYFESKPQITVFFSDTATMKDALDLEVSLKATTKVSGTKYISKDDALVIYKEQNKNDPLLLEMVTADILPASLEVSATDPVYLKELEPMISSTEGVDEVVFQKDVVDALIGWTRAIRIVGATLVGLFTVNSILIIMTVIGMKIALKKDEIEILKLIGATPAYIRMPFVLEGGAYGTMGSLIAWCILLGFLVWLQPVIFSFLGMIPLLSQIFTSVITAPFAVFSLGLLAVLSIFGFFLGSVGSLIALGRYL